MPAAWPGGPAAAAGAPRPSKDFGLCFKCSIPQARGSQDPPWHHTWHRRAWQVRAATSCGHQPYAAAASHLPVPEHCGERCTET